jgi:filamentous hemagglutinin
VRLEADTYAAGTARLDARDSLVVVKSLAAGQTLVLDADQVTNAGIIEAGVKADGSLNPSAVLNVHSRNLTNAGTLLSGGELRIEAAGDVDNRNGTIAGETTIIRSSSLSNGDGRVLADEQLDIATGALNNQAGVLQSGGDAHLIADSLTSRAGDVVASGNLTASIQTLDNTEQGRVLAGGTAQLDIATLDNRSGIVSAGGRSSFKAANWTTAMAG